MADLAPSDEDEDEEDGLLEVDSRPIPLEVFRAHVAQDRSGACALHQLNQWVLPAIASLTRDRDMLGRACADDSLRRQAEALSDSEAHWLHVLLGVQLDRRWVALCPVEERGFYLLVDGVVRNFELHTLVAAALVEQGIPGERPPKQLVAYLEGKASTPGVEFVEGVNNYYDWRAAPHDLERANDVPIDVWVWNEGCPRDVPTFAGTPALLVGPPAIDRTWNASRTFGALPARVSVDAELPRAKVRSLLDDMTRAARET